MLFQEGRYMMAKEFEGVGLTPFDPYHNSSYVVAGKWNNTVCLKKKYAPNFTRHSLSYSTRYMATALQACLVERNKYISFNQK